MDDAECQAGMNSMVEEIMRDGWEAARDRFNRSNPPGQPWAGNSKQFSFAQGEYEALCQSMPRT